MPVRLTSEKGHAPLTYSLTFGFELEGAFSQGLFDRQSGVGEFKFDGSVTSPVLENREGNGFTEYASGVFGDADRLINELSRFESPDYAHNSSCGFHLHIGLVEAGDDGVLADKLWPLVTDWKFISELQRQSDDWCECQKARNATRGIQWAKKYAGPSDLINRFHRPQKYQFLNFHGSGTAEFRFLAPCEHKAENARKLIELVRLQVLKGGVRRTERVEMPKSRKERLDLGKLIRRNGQLDLNDRPFWDIKRQGRTLKGRLDRVVNPHSGQVTDIEVIINAQGRKKKAAAFHKTVRVYGLNNGEVRTYKVNNDPYGGGWRQLFYNDSTKAHESVRSLRLPDAAMFNANELYGTINKPVRKGKGKK